MNYRDRLPKKDLGKIKRVEINVYQLVWMCPECDGGEMKYTGTNEDFLETKPEEVPHRCDKCGFWSHYKGKRFPLMEFVRSDKDPNA